jgi:hypothetical protein
LFYGEFFLEPAAAATGDGSGFIPEDVYSDRFFSASWAGEEFWQALLGNVNNFFPSSPHFGTLK